MLQRLFCSVILALLMNWGLEAAAQQPTKSPATSPQMPASRLVGENRTIPSWLVTVVHKVNPQDLERSLAQRGVAGGQVAGPIFNITTGLVIEKQGLIVAKLVNINPNAGETGVGEIKVVLPSGKQYPATFKGLDGATGICLLAIDEAQISPAKIAQTALSLGTKFTLLSAQLSANGMAQRWLATPRKNTADTTKKESPSAMECAYIPQSVTLSSILPDGQLLMDTQSIFPIMRSVRPLGVVLNKEEDVAGIVLAARNGVLRVMDAREAAAAAQRILQRGGNVPYTWLGLNCQAEPLVQVEQELARAVVADLTLGIRVKKVLPNSPARQAGFQAQDVLLRLNDQPIRALNDLNQMLRQRLPGEEVSVEFLRQNQVLKFNVKLGEREPVTALTNGRVFNGINWEVMINGLERQLAEVQRQTTEKLLEFNALKASQERLAILGENAEKIDNFVVVAPESDVANLSKQLEAIEQQRQSLQRQLTQMQRKLVIDPLVTNSLVAREWLGIEIEPFNWHQKDPANQKGSAAVDKSPSKPGERVPVGVVVGKVLPNSLAQQMGLQPNDIILRVNIYRIGGPTDLRAILGMLRQCKLDFLEFEVTRQGQKQVLRLEANELELLNK